MDGSPDLAAIIGDRLEFPAEVYLDGPEKPATAVVVKVDPDNTRLSSDPRWGMAAPEYDSYVDAPAPRLMQLCGEFLTSSGGAKLGNVAAMKITGNDPVWIDVQLGDVALSRKVVAVEFKSVGAPRSTLIREPKPWREKEPLL